MERVLTDHPSRPEAVGVLPTPDRSFPMIIQGHHCFRQRPHLGTDLVVSQILSLLGHCLEHSEIRWNSVVLVVLCLRRMPRRSPGVMHFWSDRGRLGS